MSASDGGSRAAGRWHRPGHAGSSAAELVAEPGGHVVVRDDRAAEVASVPFSALMISDRVGSIPRRVEFPDGSVFETRDNDAVDAICHAQGRTGTSFVYGLERFRPRLIVFALLAVALCAGLYRYAVPALVEVAVWATPPAVSRAISVGAMTTLDQVAFSPSELPQDRQNGLRTDFDRLAALAPRAGQAGDGPRYNLNFRKGGAIGPNAFALPDGTIVVTDELVTLAPDDDMIMGVLAHEMGHVDHDHSLRQLYRVAGITALVMLIGGDIGAATEDILMQGSALLVLSHSRDAEREADRFSVELMHRAGRDPAAIARFFDLLRDRFGLDSELNFLSTHPATSQRIEDARRLARELAGQPDSSP
jgi:Zn-dependent protease with chaperone function